jgi:hypothetical protein
MNSFCKTFAVTSALLGVMAGTASATSVGAGGSVSVFWNLDFATDIDGNYVDGTDAVTFAGLSSLTTTSRVTTENGIASDTQTTVFSFTNTSTDIYINWSAGLEAFTSASAYSSSTQFGDYYFDSNSFVSVGNISSFSSTNGGLTCSNNNPNSPNFNCFGYAQGFGDSSSDYVYGILNPGETFSFDLSVQSFATTRFTAASAVPLPASGALLGFAVLVLGVARKRGFRAMVA